MKSKTIFLCLHLILFGAAGCSEPESALNGKQSEEKTLAAEPSGSETSSADMVVEKAIADLAAAKAAEESREVAPAETASPRTTQQRLDVALETLSKATANEDRFYALGDAARLSFLTGKTEEARSFANELLSLVPEFQANWNHDNAIHVSNIVLGRIALAEGRIDDAKNHLTTAGTIHGSPQLDTYGPDMSLANDLLAKGEQQVVLDYIELCRKFWSIDAGALNRWRNDIENGTAPDFGENLVN
jgi:hypothetical protein